VKASFQRDLEQGFPFGDDTFRQLPLGNHSRS
jgi:hypothetical protein